MENNKPKVVPSFSIDVGEYIELGSGHNHNDQWIKLGYLFESISKSIKRNGKASNGNLSEFAQWCENIEAASAAKELLTEISWRPKSVDNYFSSKLAIKPEIFAGYWIALKRDDLLHASSRNTPLLNTTFSQVKTTLEEFLDKSTQQVFSRINNADLTRSEQLQAILKIIRELELA